MQGIGKPQIYVTYGSEESGYSKEEIADVRSRGYDLTHREFPGGHKIDRPLVAQGVEKLIPPPR